MTSAKQIVNAAYDIAADAAEGRITDADLDAQLEASCRELFGTVVGSGDPLFPLQIEVARGVLASAGLSGDEIQEWLAVARHRESGAQRGTGGAGAALPHPSTPEPSEGDSGEMSAESGGA